MTAPINIFGAYGFTDLASVPIAQATETVVYEAISAFLAAENSFLNDMLSLLCTFGTEVQTEFAEGGGGTFQQITDVGAVEATRTGGKWTVGFPIYAYGDRVMYSKSYLDEATLADLNRDVVDKTLKDVTTMISTVNSALLLKTNYTFNDNAWPGRRTGSINVRRLANNDSSDGEVYTPAGRVSIGTLQHYVATGTASLTTAAFATIKSKLRNVGHADRIVALCSQTTADSAEALTGFVPIKNAQVVDPQGKYAIVSSPRARGVTADNIEVWEWPHFPDGYIFGFDPSKPKPVRIREHHLAQYRGLRLVSDDGAAEIPNRPLVNKYWRRIFGAGIYNRVNGVAVHVSNADGTTYTDPTL